MFGFLGQLLKLVFVGTVAGAVAGWFRSRPVEETYNYPRPQVAENNIPTPNLRAVPAEPDKVPEPLPDASEPPRPLAEIDPEAPEVEDDLQSAVADLEPELPEELAPTAPETPIAYAELTPEATEADATLQANKPVKWVQPVDGQCPETHQIKARFSTGRYHRPGDRGYDRIIPDCCYATTEDAESDGFSRARW